MHILRSVVNKTDQVTSAPFDIIPVAAPIGDYDTATTPPIERDSEADFEGQASPRVIQWLVDRVQELMTDRN